MERPEGPWGPGTGSWDREEPGDWSWPDEEWYDDTEIDVGEGADEPE